MERNDLRLLMTKLPVLQQGGSVPQWMDAASTYLLVSLIYASSSSPAICLLINEAGFSHKRLFNFFWPLVTEAFFPVRFIIIFLNATVLVFRLQCHYFRIYWIIEIIKLHQRHSSSVFYPDDKKIIFLLDVASLCRNTATQSQVERKWKAPLLVSF